MCTSVHIAFTEPARNDAGIHVFYIVLGRPLFQKVYCLGRPNNGLYNNDLLLPFSKVRVSAPCPSKSFHLSTHVAHLPLLSQSSQPRVQDPLVRVHKIPRSSRLLVSLAMVQSHAHPHPHSRYCLAPSLPLYPALSQPAMSLTMACGP